MAQTSPAACRTTSSPSPWIDDDPADPRGGCGTVTRRPTAVFVGFIGKLPLAGMALANLHCIAGLHDLGYHVHYVERLNSGLQCYDPRTNEMTDDPAAALAFLRNVLPRYGVDHGDCSFIDRDNACHGSGWPGLEAALRETAFVLNMGDPTWFDELERCSRRAFIDTDPMFTQVTILEGTSSKVRAIEQYPIVFTEGLRVGMPGCHVPAAGRRWIPSRPAVATAMWRADAGGKGRPVSTLMNWSSGRDITYNGREYGYKNREFERFKTLPGRTDWPCAVAMGGRAPRGQLIELGWEVHSALAVTKTIEDYQAFVAESGADFGIAKHAYVESRSGWFSDRSTCYLAAGRPVLHQDTGLRDCLPVGEGLLVFSTMDEAVEGLRELKRDYERHSRAARALAEEYFEASTVLKQMLTDAGWS
jgi:hypothetical protein